MKLESLRELFLSELQDTYDAEEQIVKALPKMIGHASHSELRQALEMHLEETRGQVVRIESCFRALDMKPKREKCAGMAGIIEEGEHLVKKGGDPSAIDAAIIASAQKVEHYEICSYGTLCTYAKTLGENECLSLLKATLSEEKNADQKLTNIAESFINLDAVRTAGSGSITERF